MLEGGRTGGRVYLVDFGGVQVGQRAGCCCGTWASSQACTAHIAAAMLSVRVDAVTVGCSSQDMCMGALLPSSPPPLQLCLMSRRMCFVPPPSQAAAATAADPLGSTIVGTYGYMAPEQVCCAGHGSRLVARGGDTVRALRSTT